MKTAHFIILGIALAASGGAAYVANTMIAPATQVVEAPKSETVKVLVANADVNVGTALGAQDMRWQEWPIAAASALYINEKDSPNGVADWTGAVARAPFVAGEPIRPAKLIKGNGSGFLSAILPAGHAGRRDQDRRRHGGRRLHPAE